MSWQRIREQFEALVALPEPARAARLAELETTDPSLAYELRALLASDAGAGGFLERGPLPANGAAPQPAFAMGRRLGRFELVKPLGSGGMASVWEARQSEPARRVAIKLVARGERSDVERWRFQHEVQVLAGLNHPAIATFYEAGSDDLDGAEVAWFAMELVEGASDVLTWARTRALDREQRLQLFLRLCDAVEYGHRRGVLHRDLKPGNVLVGSDGQLKLIDFGIARALGDGPAAPAHTLTSHVVGTLQYMSPEQIAGRADTIGTPSDVWALGTILYQLLCDRAPFSFDGVPVGKIATVVLETEPPPPSRARRDLPAELDWIALRALEKEPARRYATAQALADDLARFRAHLPVSAGPPSRSYRLRKFARRHRVGVAIAAALMLGLGAGAWGLVHGMRQARAGERKALHGRDLAFEVASVTAGLFDAIDDTEASRDVRVHQVLDASSPDGRAFRDPSVELALREMRGEIYGRLHRFAEARHELERARALQHEIDLGELAPAEQLVWDRRCRDVEASLGRAMFATGDREAGWQLVRAVVDATAAAADDQARLRALGTFCGMLCDANRFAELEPNIAALREVAQRVAHAPMLQRCEQWSALVASAFDRHDEAKHAAERSWASAKDLFGARHARSCEALSTLVTVLQKCGDDAGAAGLYPELIELMRELYGATHPHTLTVLNNHAGILLGRGDVDGAIAQLRGVVAAYDARGAVLTPQHTIAISNLGQMLYQRTRFADAEPFLARAAAATSTVFDAHDTDGPSIRFNHAACLGVLKRWREAEPILLTEYAALEKVLPPTSSQLRKMRHTISDLYQRNGSAEQAAAWRTK